MKRFFKTICIFLSLSFAFTASTFGWFTQADVVNFRTDFSSLGSAKASYFKEGDGSEQNPYVISSATHVYNLAWLQYLGYFNHASVNNDKYQSYFKIDDGVKEIDMTNVKALPPIGTAQYPFIGNFNGNGAAITKLNISNADEDLSPRPTAARFKNGKLYDAANSSEVNIVGLFGVTGDYGSTETTGGVVKAAYGEHLQSSVPDSGAAADTAYGSLMSVSNFYSDNLSVKSVSENTLVGLAAGYANATIGKVGVYRCDISVNANADGLNAGDAISKYSLVGDYNESTVTWVEKPGAGGEAGDDTAWGGSIDMRTLNRRLEYMLGKAGKKSGSTATNISDSDYMLYARAPGSEYNWDSTTLTGYQTVYLADNTVLPLNVDMAAMGLDSPDVSSEGNSKEIASSVDNNPNFLNVKYRDNTGETVGAKNTGYIVGGGSILGSTAYIRARIQSLATGSQGGSESGIYKSQGFASYSNGAQKYNKEKFVMLTIADGKTYIVSDSVNNATADNDVFSSTGTIAAHNSKDLHFESNGKLYLSVRENFDTTMEGAYMVHGFHFMNSLSADSVEKQSVINSKVSLQNVTYSMYEFMKGGLNFTLEENGVIKAIVGACYGSTQNTMFDLYKVNRTITTGGTSPAPRAAISTVERIAQIYKNKKTNEISYNTKPSGDDWQLAFDFDALTKTDCLENGAAYYFEIPVLKGDYVIGSDKTSTAHNAYLMYLDIGANGSGESGADTPVATPYSISALDFVNDVEDGFQTEYKDVTFKLSNVTASADGLPFVSFEREAASATIEKANTKVIYTYVAVAVEPTPSTGLSGEKGKDE